MASTRRRRFAVFLIVIFSFVSGGIVAIASAAGDNERITGYWVGAVLADDGLHVTEVIDYEFGVARRRGIFRIIPDAVVESVSASSPTAPDAYTVSDLINAVEIRIGDPAVTITGRHRYRIDYILPPDAIVRDGVFSWDAIGTDWTVGIHDITIALALAGDLDRSSCRQGTPWSSRGCSIQQRGPGQLQLGVDSLGAGDGVTVSGTILGGEPPAAFPIAPSGPASDPGAGILQPFLVSVAASLVGGLAAAVFARRMGRERVWTGGAADAAFGEIEEGLGLRRLDEKELAALATIEFEPPRATSAVEGGILLRERVDKEHMSAWLLESAIRDEIEITGGAEPALRWGSAPAHPSVHQILDGMFGGRSEVELGSYDPTFSSGWERLSSELSDWLSGSAHWDSKGRQMRLWAIASGIVGGLVAAVVLVIATVIAARHGGSSGIAIAAAAVVVGFAVGLVISSSELLIRTETGSAMWLRVESFRRFLEQSEARHVTEAAEKGVLRQYTAWAVALGETDAWTDAVEEAARTQPELTSSLTRDLAFVTVGSHIASAASSATTAPSSSSGGFSGGVGGGGGGGGGGSW